MKTQNKKPSRRIERYSLSDMIGTRRGGFFDKCACEIRDLVPQNGSFRLRNGTVEAFTVDSPILFSGSVNNNGNITGYVSEANLLYELMGPYNTGVSEARYISDSSIRAEDTFFFTSGGCTYMMTSGRICKRYGDEFEDFDSFGATVDVDVKKNTVTEDECKRATNLFSGCMDIRFTLDGDGSTIRFGTPPDSVHSVTVNGTNIEDVTLDGDTLTVGCDLYAGDVVCIRAGCTASAPDSLSLTGASGENGGRTYLYSKNAMYRVSTIGDALFCSRPVLTLPEGGLRRAFFCSGTLVLAIGEGLCVFDEEKCTLRTIGGEGAQSERSICACGGYAFVASDGYLTRLTISQSGETETLRTETVRDVFDYRQRGEILGMAYSRADRCLWTLVDSDEGRRIFTLDVESGIWNEITCFSEPSAIIECEDCIAIICGRTVYYSSPDLTYDEREDGSYPISGTLVLNPSDLGDPFSEKRAVCLAVKASTQVTDIAVTLTTDRGREFTEKRKKEYGDVAFELFCPRLGLFRYVSAAITVTGYGNADLCGVELDVRSK